MATLARSPEMRPKANPTTGANPTRVRADQERRRSGAAGAHDSRPNRQRARAAARDAAIRQSY